MPDEAAVVARLRAAGCVFAEDEARLLIAAGGGLDELVARRVAGEPLEQLLGWVAFGGLRLAAAAGVFVPRRRTELLAALALGRARRRPDPVVVELCCGVAAVAAVLAEARPAARVHAADLDPVAVEVARRNLEHRGGRVYHGDLYAALPQTLRGQVDVLVANAPYVPTEAIALMPPEAREHEPLLALDGGADGLDVQRRVAAGAARWLAPGGAVLIETSGAQATRSAQLLTEGGLRASVEHRAELDGTAVVGVRRP